MKILIIFSTFIIAKAEIPDETGYNTPHLQIVKRCEEKLQISEEEKQILWDWKMPTNPTKCLFECNFAGFGWTDESGNINVSFENNLYRNLNIWINS